MGWRRSSAKNKCNPHMAYACRSRRQIDRARKDPGTQVADGRYLRMTLNNGLDSLAFFLDSLETPRLIFEGPLVVWTSYDRCEFQLAKAQIFICIYPNKAGNPLVTLHLLKIRHVHELLNLTRHDDRETAFQRDVFNESVSFLKFVLFTCFGKCKLKFFSLKWLTIFSKHVILAESIFWSGSLIENHPYKIIFLTTTQPTQDIILMVDCWVIRLPIDCNSFKDVVKKVFVLCSLISM